MSVNAQTIRIGDVVRVRGTFRVVRDLRSVPGGGRLLVFTNARPFRLNPAATLDTPGPRAAPGRSPQRSAPAGAPRSWQIAPGSDDDADPVTQAMMCRVCGLTSPQTESAHPGRVWMLEHAGKNPTHRAYHQITRTPWRATLAPSPTTAP
ncbi:hypothetical protein LHJ74_28170 [Streptomyces sp. N2-109]|uniref:DUF7848 domain-containing protein n=1 Tax=Streptomyces gossypii TaxID=2883101 RepID=A0ABT2JYM8_9ACTN|nr:hypothetical protein [Streptomyces gossypii]MCT2593003.1 hypothetical protein [Streptomyces gossypii]MCT2593736.1 hypothetical protein [Streptomyces gossypii]